MPHKTAPVNFPMATTVIQLQNNAVLSRVGAYLWSFTYFYIHAVSVYKKQCKISTSAVSYFSSIYNQCLFLIFLGKYSQRFLNFCKISAISRISFIKLSFVRGMNYICIFYSLDIKFMDFLTHFKHIYQLFCNSLFQNQRRVSQHAKI